jgi:hypothetical protein
MQEVDKRARFACSTIKLVELVMRHILRGGVLNAKFLREHCSDVQVLSVASLLSDASTAARSRKYSKSIVSFVLILVAQATYFNEEITVQDAVERGFDLFGLSGELFQVGKEAILVMDDNCIESRRGFKERYGFSVDVDRGSRLKLRGNPCL